MITRRLALFVAIVLAMSVRAAAAQYRIDTWTTEQGLPQNSVNAVLQTRDGFIWMTTFGGIVRFDSVNLDVFNTVNTPALRTSRFTSLIEDSSGALWINADVYGVARYQNGAFTSFGVPDGLPEDQVRSVFLDADGHVIVDTRGGAVEFRDGHFVARPDIPSEKDSSKAMLSHGSGGTIWYFQDGKIRKWDRGRITRELSMPRPRRVFEDPSGSLWIETWERHLVCVTGDRVIEYGAKDGLHPFATMAVSADRGGTLWFGMRGGQGLLRFRAGKFSEITKADGLPNDHVGNVVQDREGTIWVPTEGGLARLTDRPITSYSTADGLATNNSYPIYQDRRGDVWIGGWAGLTRFRDGKFTDVSNAMGIAGESVDSILEDRSGALWIGTFGGIVRRVANGKATSIQLPDEHAIRALYEDRAGDLWVGGQGGVGRIRDGIFVPEKHYDGGETFVFFEDRHGTLWIGNQHGVTRYANGAFTTFGADQGLSDASVREIHEDADGGLWFGTYDQGLFRYRDGKIFRLTTAHALPTNGAFRIIEDDRGWFWMSSNVGIYRVERRSLDDVAEGRARSVTAVLYGRRDGMLNTECNGGNQSSGIRARDGRIWFPTQAGVAVFDPTTIPVNSQPPPVAITGILVGSMPVPVSDRIEIRSGSTAFEAHFAALTFVRPELSRFRFRMDGLDPDWVEAGGQRTARYAQLPYGDFHFHVIAANRDGIWNDTGAAIAVSVVPPFWRTSWFFALLGLAAVGIGFGAHRVRVGVLERQQKLREIFSRQLIESQENDRSRIAAGLHDSLSQTLIVMKNWAVMGQDALPSGHRARATLGDISTAASTALQEVREISYNLGPYQLQRFGLSPTIVEMAEKVAGAAGIEVTARVAPAGAELSDFSKEAQLAVFRIIQEAMNNIVKHSGATRVSLAIDVDDAGMHVDVVDNGRGFDYPAESAGSPRADGFGLFGMSERMRLLGGRILIDTSPGNGTRIHIDVPRTK
jgi:signal transduction histidine kinase/ligand-binding sensor domain-containing protein